jgi:hypothetical protein
MPTFAPNRRNKERLHRAGSIFISVLVLPPKGHMSLELNIQEPVLGFSSVFCVLLTQVNLKPDRTVGTVTVVVLASRILDTLKDKKTTASLLRILEVPGSNPGLETDYTD